MTVKLQLIDNIFKKFCFEKINCIYLCEFLAAHTNEGCFEQKTYFFIYNYV